MGEEGAMVGEVGRGPQSLARGGAGDVASGNAGGATPRDPSTGRLAPTCASLDERRGRLALDVVRLARDRVVAEHHFLAPAAGALALAPARVGRLFATDGVTLWYDPDCVLADFDLTRKPPVRDYTHVLLHCLLLHPFTAAGRGIDRADWSLACDIVAERLTVELCGARDGDRGAAEQLVLGQLDRELGGAVTAERMYRALRRGSWRKTRDAWAKVFAVDEDEGWFPAPGRPQGGGDAGAQGSSPTSAGAPGQAGAPQGGSRGSRDASAGEGAPDGAPGAHGAPDPARLARQGRQAREEARGRWERMAKSVRVDLETFSRGFGGEAGELARELSASTASRTDYRSFLRRFARPHEAMRVSPDEFDYVFYTYGLELYGDMPLIEPLEYREERLVRDFVIVLDTSASVDGEAVQAFVDATFSILTDDGAFCDRVNVHLIQADAKVQSDTRLTSLDDLGSWHDSFTLRGFGGTDFRPAFAYVDELVRQGEFQSLEGLIYFTDGWGTYPTRVPSYRCAFVFYDEDYRADCVPPWAIQVVLAPGELEEVAAGARGGADGAKDAGAKEAGEDLAASLGAAVDAASGAAAGLAPGGPAAAPPAGGARPPSGDGGHGA